MKKRLIAIHGGGDWSDASVTYLVVPPGVVLAEAQAARQEWYNTVYLPAFRANKRIKYMDLADFLIDRYGATVATTEVEVFDDGL